MGYAVPANVPISATWQDHKNRNPPSSEPGTDYATGYGTGVACAESGTVSHIDTNSGGGEGRCVGVSLDDGRYVRYLHMDSIAAYHGQRVARGQILGLSGASGYNDNWYYGPHVHVSLWERPGMPFNQTIDFQNYVGGGALEPHQRRVLSSAPANGRSDPSTANPATQSLPPGTVANMDGWIYGEAVSGNNMWFHGAISGDWFWSGGFDGGADASNLTDLNMPSMAPNQRYATEAVNGRAEPNTSSTIVTVLAAGTVGDFDGWINGQSVEGDARWLRGSHSGAFFSLKHLTPSTTDGLVDLNAPTSSSSRTVLPVDVNLRGGPFTTYPVIGSGAPNAVLEMDGWAHGENVQGIDVWYRVKANQLWGWAGGFTTVTSEGLDEITAIPVPPNANNPRGLPEYEPVNPAAIIGLVAPLGFDEDGEPQSRAYCGSTPTTAVIDRAIIHHTGTTSDQLDYFSYRNDRSSCPTWYVRPNGDRIELIRPGIKPASTGPDWNCRSVAWEVLDETGDPYWLIPEPARRSVAEDIAWLAEFDGKELDGIPVSFRIDAEHVIGHNQALPGQTICPGPDMDVPGIIAMAQAIWDENHPTDPCPECPECPDPGPGEEVEVPRVQLVEWQDEARSTYEEIGTLLEGASHA